MSYRCAMRLAPLILGLLCQPGQAQQAQPAQPAGEPNRTAAQAAQAQAGDAARGGGLVQAESLLGAPRSYDDESLAGPLRGAPSMDNGLPQGTRAPEASAAAAAMDGTMAGGVPPRWRTRRAAPPAGTDTQAPLDAAAQIYPSPYAASNQNVAAPANRVPR
jgi:hypothetical protein